VCARVSLKSGIAKFWAKSESLPLLLYVHSQVRFIYLFIYFLGVGVFVGLSDKINTKIRRVSDDDQKYCFLLIYLHFFFISFNFRNPGALRWDALFCGVSLPSLSLSLLTLSLVVPPVFLFLYQTFPSMLQSWFLL